MASYRDPDARVLRFADDFGLPCAPAAVRGAASALARGHLPWHQNARAARPHLGVLKKVVVVPSRESAAQFEDLFRPFFKSGLAAAAGREIDVVAHPTGGVDYEDYEALRDALTEVLRDLETEHRARPDEICIDVTAGQKPFSLVAAIMTLNRAYHFSYVGTNSGHARSYDAEARLPSLLEA